MSLPASPASVSLPDAPLRVSSPLVPLISNTSCWDLLYACRPRSSSRGCLILARMQVPAGPSLPERIRRLRMQGAYARAREEIRSEPGFIGSAPLQRLLHEHGDVWWQPVQGRRVTLRRRCEDD